MRSNFLERGGWLLLVGLAYIPMFIFRDFAINSEIRYLSIVDEALRSGNYFTFTNDGEIYGDKPPLYFWLLMIGKVVFGEHTMIYAASLSLLPALGIVKTMDDFAKSFMSAQARQVAGISLFVTGLFMVITSVVRMDMLMSFFIVRSCYVFFRMYSGEGKKYDWFLLPVLIFMGLFSKGLVGMFVPLLAIIIFLFYKRDQAEIGRYLGWRQWLIILALCILWFSMAYLEGGKEYLNNLLFKQTVGRGIDSFHHKEPFYYYLEWIWVTFLPWSLVMIVGFLAGIKEKLFKSDAEKLMTVLVITTFTLLSIVSSKITIYLLPVYPFVAYLSVSILERSRIRRLLKVSIYIPVLILALAFPVSLVLLYLSIQGELEFEVSNLIPVATLALTVMSVLAFRALKSGNLVVGMGRLSVGILIMLGIGGFGLSTYNPLYGAADLCRYAKTVAERESIDHFSAITFRNSASLSVFLGQSVDQVDEVEEIDSLINSGEPQILFVKHNTLDYEEFEAAKPLLDQYPRYEFPNHHFYIIK